MSKDPHVYSLGASLAPPTLLSGGIYLGASVWPDEWRRGNKWDGGAGEGSWRAKPGGGLPCLLTPFLLLISATCHMGGVAAPHRGLQAGLPKDL